MEKIKISKYNDLDFDKISNLYLDAEWTNYTYDLDKLDKSLKNSLLILTACIDNEIVGLIRVIGDSFSIIYIQDIIVLKKYKRKGIGKKLLNEVLNIYSDVRQIVLLTDNTPETTLFYEKCGLTKTDDLNLKSFIRIK